MFIEGVTAIAVIYVLNTRSAYLTRNNATPGCNMSHDREGHGLAGSDPESGAVVVAGSAVVACRAITPYTHYWYWVVVGVRVSRFTFLKP